jgi:asparagine synthase (glutamine-hydrolysing)
MCGIAGKIRYDGRDERDTLAQMVARMRHRGPDHQAVQDIDGVAAFGHARLSIIDLSPLGNQPMSDESGRYTISYNGEVYNYRELRTELCRLGHRFRSQSDTEVILGAYAQWGTGAFRRLSGMFALALWDRKEQELVLCRDRFGEKPLYYSVREGGGGLSFASECSALLCDEAVRRGAQVSVAGLNHYFALGYTLAPLTIYRNIHKLEPATWLRFRAGRVVEKARYWDYRAHFADRSRERPAEVVEHLDLLLQRAVRARLVSDVPVGAFLSGGMDSSAIVALMRRHLPYELHTFTIGFSEHSYNEAHDARIVAEHLRTVHHERVLRLAEGGRVSHALSRAIASYDEPFSDTSLVPTVEVARSAARFVKVVLSGDGADELLGGYPTYQADRLLPGMERLPQGVRRAIAGILRRSPDGVRGRTGLGFKLRQLGKGIDQDYRYAHYAWRELHSEAERVALIGPEHAEEVRATHPFLTFLRYYDEAAALDRLSQHLYVDAKTWLCDDVLVKVDRATMAASIEARAPFLDEELAQYVAGLPPELKVGRGRGKLILTEVLRRYLPEHTLRKRKAGFNAPINAWLGQAGENEFRYFNRYVATQRGLLSDVALSHRTGCPPAAAPTGGPLAAYVLAPPCAVPTGTAQSSLRARSRSASPAGVLATVFNLFGALGGA